MSKRPIIPMGGLENVVAPRMALSKLPGLLRILRAIPAVKALDLDLLSKPVLLFAATIVSTASTFAILQLIKLIKALLRRQPRKSLYGSKTRVIHVPYKDRRLTIELEKINFDRYEHDRLVLKQYLKDPSSSGIESRFLSKLHMIWKLVLIPRIFDKNASLLLAQIGFLVARTWFTLLVTRLDGQIMKDLVGFRVKLFLRDIVYWFLFAVPASYVNAGIRFLTRRLALNFRTNLVRYCHDLYMNSHLAYYKLQFNNSEGYDLNHQTIDQNLTEDIRKFSDSITSLFANVGKPTIDLIFFAIYLRDNLGAPGIVAILLNYLVTGVMLKRQSPNFNNLWKERTQKEATYYNYNLNLITNAEEISFYKGIGFEHTRVSNIFKDLTSQIVKEITQRFHYQLFEEYLLNYVWPGFGYLFAGLPIIFSKSAYETEETNMKSFIVNKRLILSMADAGSRLMYSVKEISRLSAATDVIFSLLVNLHKAHDAHFEYGLKGGGDFASRAKISSFSSKLQLNVTTVNGLCGTIQTQYPGIRMERIPVIVPSSDGLYGKHLIENLSFNISQGQNLLILGKSGVGKTSIIRIISELWPIYSGLLSKPSSSDIYYVSQRPYFMSGSLRDQIIYPLSHMQMLQQGYTDDILIEYMREVGLGYLVDRYGLDYNPAGQPTVLIDEVVVNSKIVPVYDSNVGGPTDGKKTWLSLLSGGERQKLVFARILFHNKRYVVMDEPTSAISFDYEDILFDMMHKKGFTFITISNRESLLKYHNYLLEVENKQAKFVKIDEDYLKHFESVQSEIDYLERKLEKREKLQARREELKALLDGYE